MKDVIIILDDEPSVRDALAVALEDLDCEVMKYGDPHRALEAIPQHKPKLVLTDLQMPGLNGMEVLSRIRLMAPDVQVVMVTGHGSVEDAVAAIKKGAYDFLLKPFKVTDIEVVVRRALEKARLLEENGHLRENLQRAHRSELEAGKDQAFRDLLESAELAAQSEANILILGESGTGKEVLALHVVSHSPRSSSVFVTVNCAAIPENLLESELFGHKRGAFTGAHQDRKGRFQEAHGGTIFLDEIGELPLPVQAKLLRVLQTGEVAPVGGSPRKVDVRVVAATNRPLSKMVADGLFREDLYYRLKVFSLQVPPLRRRAADIPTYARFFVEKHCRKRDREPPLITPEAMQILEGYSWPGNLRELENVIERALILARDGHVTTATLPPEVTGETEETQHLHFPRGMTLDEIERRAIASALDRNHGDRAKTATELGIGERTLYRRLSELNTRTVTKKISRPL